MEIGKQIKKYRTELGLSQEDFADKIFVTRQSVSNWENDKNYPDVNSLVLMAEIFGVSLDILIKGDIEEMQEKIKKEDIENFKKQSNILALILFGMLLLPIPLLKFLDIWGLVIYVVFGILGLCYAFKIEKRKKELDIGTYKEISAFTEGKRLDEIEKEREKAKRPYQQILLGLGSVVTAFIVCSIMAAIFKL